MPKVLCLVVTMCAKASCWVLVVTVSPSNKGGYFVMSFLC